MREKVNHIVNWIAEYSGRAKLKTLVVGVSGGIDSAVVSTLCAESGIRTIPIVMTIRNKDILALEHVWWLEEKYGHNVSRRVVNLEKIFTEIENASKYIGADSELAFANTRSRLRMLMLYQMAQSEKGLVVGTGNKVEDFGVGFYTKYGDGGVDISPIADCLKTEVWKMADYLGISKDIIDAPPTDGLWEDNRTDEDQLGLSYEQLERAMKADESGEIIVDNGLISIVEKFRTIRAQNKHKMSMPPVCSMEKFR
ncbi:NAD(+) synthase [Candidatus Woesearchaeota archaeon]|jgi:NAD+ synthase|nr:NAD(+) synthase [Candidatus Woesearchaeota archaeon]|tara:strand:+ start:290 stop:1051 length:762 start_codon:yes stop_codon:yes gene_type:complete